MRWLQTAEQTKDKRMNEEQMEALGWEKDPDFDQKAQHYEKIAARRCVSNTIDESSSVRPAGNGMVTAAYNRGLRDGEMINGGIASVKAFVAGLLVGAVVAFIVIATTQQ
jgi:hypothetical protein